MAATSAVLSPPELDGLLSILHVSGPGRQARGVPLLSRVETRVSELDFQPPGFCATCARIPLLASFSLEQGNGRRRDLPRGCRDCRPCTERAGVAGVFLDMGEGPSVP